MIPDLGGYAGTVLAAYGITLALLAALLGLSLWRAARVARALAAKERADAMGSRINPLLALPPLLFAVFAGVAYLGLTRENADTLPSALIGRAAPSLAATEPLRADPAPTDAELTAPGVKLVNFWASWCAPCRAEHPILKEISASGVPVIGVNYKDAPENALGFLAEMGDPFTRIGADPKGRVALDWGIYGVPETFVVDASGKILLRYPGPLTEAAFDAELRPLIEKGR